MLIGDLHFAVRESPRRKTLGITVERDGSLHLDAPVACPPNVLATWAHSKRMWVYRKLAEKDLLLSRRPDKEFSDGEGFSYLGRSYRVLLTEVNDVSLQRGRLLIPKASVADNTARPRLIDWYRRHGKRWLPNRIGSWAARTGLHPAGLDVRDLGYRWGSLSANGRLNIHWATLQLPPSLVDYVLVHELAHVAHPQHTHRFWSVVERAIPDYERRKSDLLTAGAQLWMG